MYRKHIRMEDTHNAVMACLDDVQCRMEGEARQRMPESEIGHFENMVRDMVDWLYEQGILDATGNIDEVTFSDMLDMLATDTVKEALA